MGFTTLDRGIINTIIPVFAASLAMLAFALLFKNLKDAKIVNVIIFISIFVGVKIYVMPYYEALTFDAKLKQQFPIYTTISKYYPKEYDEFVAQMKINIIEKHDFNKAMSDSQKLISNVIDKSIPFAANKDIYNWLKTSYAVEKKLYNINTEFVLALESPDRISNQLSVLKVINSIPKSDLDKILTAKENVIISGAIDKTNHKLSDSQIEKGISEAQQVYIILIEKYGEDLVNDTFKATTPFKDPANSAKVILMSYELFLSKSEDEVGLIFKALFTPSTPEKK